MSYGGLVVDPRVGKAISHPLRLRILSILEQRRASPRELAQELGVPLANVSYHVRTLRTLRLIKMVEVKGRRGSIEHFYESVAALHRLTDNAWEKMPSIAKQAVVSSVLDEIGEDVGKSAAWGGFEAADAHLGRMNLLLDAQGCREASAALSALYEKLSEVEKQCAARLAAVEHPAEEPCGFVALFYRKPSASGGGDVPPEESAPADETAIPGTSGKEHHDPR